MSNTGDADAIRRIVVDALDAAAGIRGDPRFAGSLLRGDDMTFADLEIDSLARFEVMMHLEEALGIELDDDEIAGASTLDGLVQHLARAVAANSGDGMRGG
jgi:acyl carrier protein